MAKTSCEFNTAEQSTKAWFRTKGLIDTFNRILNLNEFRKQNTKWSNYARLKFGTTGNLFLETYGGKKAIPNREVFDKIERRRQEELETTKNIGEEGVSELFDSNPELANSVYSALGFNFRYTSEKWKDDPTTENKATYINIKGTPSNQEFQIKKDIEDGFYSVHFKTEQGKLTKEQIQTLVDAIASQIPIGGKLSTWGNITKGGISGLNRFLNNGFEKVGEREIKDREGNPIIIPILEKVEKSNLEQQAQQLYSQYLEQNPNGSVEEFKSWVDEFNKNNRIPLTPTAEQLKHIKPLSEKLIKQINNWIDKPNKDILNTLKLYAEVYAKDKELENLIQILIDNVDKIKFVKFKGIGKLQNDNHQAEYDGETGEIFVNNIMYQPNNRDVEDRLYRTIIHEYLHGYFLSVLNSPKTEQEKQLVEYINEAYDVLTFEYEGTNKWYGFHNVDEFVSELLSNKEFRESEQVKKTGILQKILNFINQIFFKKYGKNSIEIKQNVFNKLLENISILEPSLVKYADRKGSLSDFISQKSQDLQSFQQSLNKPNTNPILQGNQQEQVKKFAELQERLNNKEFLEGAKNAFESSEELQNVYYEAAGFDKTLEFYEGDNLKIDDKTYTISEKISSKELAKRNGLTISSNVPVYIVNEPLGLRKGGYDTVNNIIILSKNSDKETIQHELIHSVEYNLDKKEIEPLYQKVKNTITEDSFNGFVSWNFKKSISEFIADALSKKVFRDALKKEGLLEEIDNTLSVYSQQLTPQQKQDALNAYTDYIARVSLGIIKNPSSGDYNYTSKVKDIVYHGTDTKFDKFSKEFIGTKEKGALAYGFTFGGEQAKVYAGNYGRGEKILLNNFLDIKNPLIFNRESKFGSASFPNFKENLFLIDILKRNGYDVTKWKYFSNSDNGAIPDYIRQIVTENIFTNILKKEGYDGIISKVPNKKYFEYVVFEPEQIHILGSKQDIEGFKDFVQGKPNNVKLGVKELFNENPELANVGTQEQYSQYLNTIFPDSKVKDIVYRGGNLGTKQPQDVEAFTTNKSYAKYRAEQNNTQVYPAILNIQESKLLDKKEIRTLSLDRDEFEYQDYGFTDNKDQTKQLGNFYTIKENNRHILGSKQDIEGFKEFVAKYDAELVDLNEQPIKSQYNSGNTALTLNQVIAVEKFSKALGIKYNVPVHTVYSDIEKSGWIENGVVYINLTKVKADTPIHEFGHIFVAIIKKENPELYKTLKQELLSSKEGIQVLREVRSKTLYQGGSNEGQIEEAIVELIGRKGVKYIGENKKLMALVTDFFTWIANTIKEFLGFRVDRLTNIKDIAKRISLGEDVDLSSEVIGLDYSQSSQIPFSEDLVTNDTSIFYENADKSKVTLRASFMEVLLSPFRKAGAKELSYEERAAEIFRRNNIPLDGVYEHKINNRVYGTLTLQEYADELRMRENRARLEGKAVHKYFQFLTTKVEAYKTEAESLAAQAGMDLDALYSFVGLYDLAQNRLNKKQTDTTYVEKTLTMDIPEFEIEDNTGAKVKVTGISGTMDEMIDHGDNVFTIVDYKTGAFDTLGLNVNHLMKYSKKAGVNWKFDSYHKNMLKTALYAVLLKSKVPQARFRNVYMAQVNEHVGFDLKEVELEPALKILSLYFKENHNAFWIQNQELFNPRTIKESYVNKKVLEAKVTNPSITKGEVISTYKEELLAELRQVAAFRAMLKKNKDLDADQAEKLASTEMRYKALVGQLAEIDLGFDPISLGTRQGLDIISAKITNLYHKSNPLIEYFRPMFYHGKNRARQEGFKLEREHNKYIVELEKEFYKNNRKKFVGANYEEFYEFLWDMNEDREIWLTTYKSNKWSELTQAQKNYADYYRWTMRYHMFLTMRPEMGIKFIQDELADRKDLTAEQISMLKSQITELEKQPKWNKFIQSKFPKFEYFEGWTPRVIKTAEESANFKQYWKNALDSTLLSNDEDEKVLHANNEELSLTGLPLRYFGYGEESALKHKELYTFNGELTLAYFVQSMLNKQYLDDVYNIGVGIDLYWRNQDEKGLNKNNISFLQNVLKSLILQQKMDDFQGRTVGIPILNEEGKIEQRRIHVDTLVKFLRVTFAVPALALNILGAATTGTAQIIRLITQAGTGSIYKHTTGKDADLSTRDAAAAVAPLASWIKDSMLNFKGNGKLEKNKLHLFLQYTGFLPAGYENNPSSARRLKTTQGFVLGKKIDNELLLSLYSKVDNLIYSAYLYGQLKNIKWTDKNGKKWNMWEAYEVRDGEMVYIGGERGVDANSGKVITELTSEELVKIKAFSSRDLGAYREEEKNALESSAIGLFYMTFKRWMPSIVQRAFMPEFQDATLGKWVNSGGAIDPETGLPVMTWLKEHNQGFIRTLLKSIAIAALFLKDRKQAKSDFNNLSEAQKQNIIFALAKLSMYAGLMMAVSAMFGDADADDDNKIKQAAIRVARDSSFEFIVFDFEGWGRTLTSVPSFEKAWEFTGGSMNVIFNGVIPDILPGFEPTVVQSGPHEGWYKGTTQVLRNTKFLSTGYSLWQMDNSWADLQDDIARLN